MADVECAIARIHYQEGRNGIEIAEMWIASCVGALIEVQNARALNPAAFPTYPVEAAPHTAARMITARLLDAGWRPPDGDCLTLPDDTPAAS
jgi:hypothetical protein